MKYYVGSIACDPYYLKHFGIIGQKWGVRRYQNEDGTLTEEGKQRYRVGDDDVQGLSEQGKKEFFEGKSSRYSVNAERYFRENGHDTQLGKLIDSEKFGRNYEENDNWLNSYNAAVRKFNPELEKINKRWGDDTNVQKDRKTWVKYIREVGKTWTKIYSEQLLNDFGEHPAMGKDWVQLAFSYGMYDGLEDIELNN